MYQVGADDLVETTLIVVDAKRKLVEITAVLLVVGLAIGIEQVGTHNKPSLGASAHHITCPCFTASGVAPASSTAPAPRSPLVIPPSAAPWWTDSAASVVAAITAPPTGTTLPVTFTTTIRVAA